MFARVADRGAFAESNYRGKHAGLGSGLRLHHLHKKQRSNMARTKEFTFKQDFTRTLVKHHPWLKASHPRPPSEKQHLEISTTNPADQAHSVDQRPSLGSRPVGRRWSPPSTGPTRESLHWVVATTTIVLPPVSLGTLGNFSGEGIARTGSGIARNTSRVSLSPLL